ncbi:MAG TPA: penicillin-binding protein 1C [Rhodobacteraceae bacterium]|jgi:penicillin-binding protein 1C|nr:penicillin-binding protein 1C [Paracoccaceae bacterium]HBG99849.1 penicillin-binding protein 1C [Paracoccaceae bacterium]
MSGRAILGLAVGLFLAALGRDGFDRWVDATHLPALARATSVEMRARDGALLRAYTVDDGRWRMAVAPDAVDPRYLAMLIAYEDKRFWDHPGVDIQALARAAGQALRHGRIVSGGSTLTMQVARLLEDGSTGRWPGKLRQIRVALALERRLGKSDILALYLQLAPFGGNIEGVRAASLAYFGKEPAQLTPAEAALLVALPQAPEARRPDRVPAAARAARARVLDRLAAAGVIGAEAQATARAAPVPDARRPFPALAPHLTDRMRAADPGRAVHHLQIDAGLQASLEALATRAARETAERVSVAILVADHRSGAVLAQVGSAGYGADRRAGFVDMTRAVRSPGSTLKPLIYGLAFDRGLAHPETRIDDLPAIFDGYAPTNFDGLYRGEVSVRTALQLSLNIPAVRLTEAVGPAPVMARLRRAGARPVLPGGQPGLAIALGGVGVTLEDLVALYAGLANGGIAVPLASRADAPASQPARPVLSAAAAWHVGDILSGLPPPPGAPRNGLAYKTGTSYGHRDAWALGFDGRHVAGVWIGRPDGTPVPGAFGGALAAPILFEVFGRLKPALDPLPGPPPAALVVSHAALPWPLQRFRPRGAAAAAGDPDAPILAFPPDGAELAADGTLPLRVEAGRGPFTWLADGAPIAVARRDRQIEVPAPGPGFVVLSVIDAEGRAARSHIRIDPHLADR